MSLRLSSNILLTALLSILLYTAGENPNQKTCSIQLCYCVLSIVQTVGGASNKPIVFPYKLIGLVGRVFANGAGDQGSIPGRVIPKTLKMVLDASLLNIQQYKVRIKGKVEQSRERSSTLPYTSV